MSASSLCTFLSMHGHTVLPPFCCRVLNAIDVLDQEGEVTVRKIARHLDRQLGGIVPAMRRLREAGLIDFEDGKYGTVRFHSKLEIL